MLSGDGSVNKSTKIGGGQDGRDRGARNENSPRNRITKNTRSPMNGGQEQQIADHGPRSSRQESQNLGQEAQNDRQRPQNSRQGPRKTKGQYSKANKKRGPPESFGKANGQEATNTSSSAPGKKSWTSIPVISPSVLQEAVSVGSFFFKFIFHRLPHVSRWKHRKLKFDYFF